jgi:NTE family protein
MGKKPMTALVLGGGGARGALQVGAMRALMEAGLQPGMLVGTSIGAANATFLAIHGFTPDGLAGLTRVWHRAAESDLLPDRYLWITLRALFNRQGGDEADQIRQFFVQQGLEPQMRFGDLVGPRLFLVAADLKAGSTVVFGTDPNHRLLDGVLASCAIPPWVRPLPQDDRLLMDGGVVSNVPIEPALSYGATEIMALDLADPRPVGPGARGFGPFLFQLTHTVQQRQLHLEMDLAAARGVPVHHIKLLPPLPIAVWELERSVALIDRGYALMQEHLAAYPDVGRPPQRRASWWRRLFGPRTLP